MSQTAYEYRFFKERDGEPAIETKLNELGKQGWRVIHYSKDGNNHTALLERSNAIKDSHKTSSS